MFSEYCILKNRWLYARSRFNVVLKGVRGPSPDLYRYGLGATVLEGALSHHEMCDVTPCPLGCRLFSIFISLNIVKCFFAMRDDFFSFCYLLVFSAKGNRQDNSSTSP